MTLIFRSLGLFWAEESSFEDVKTIHEEPETSRNRSDRFFTLNDDCLVQDMHRDLVSLESSGNEDSEYVFKIVLACLWTKWQHKTSHQFIKSLCDETVFTR